MYFEYLLKFEKVGIYFEVFWSGKIHTSTGSRGQWDVVHGNVPKHSVSTDTRKDDLYQKKSHLLKPVLNVWVSHTINSSIVLFYCYT